jgi:hypothetical protein
MTSRRALERADDVLEAGSASCAYAVRRVQSTAAATEGGSPVDHPSHRQARNLDRQGRGGADPRARPRRPRPADSPGVRSRPRERNGPIAAPRPGAVDPKADERTPEGSQHRARDSAVTSRQGRRLRRRLWRWWYACRSSTSERCCDEPAGAAAGPGARVRGHGGGGYGAGAVAGGRRCAACHRLRTDGGAGCAARGGARRASPRPRHRPRPAAALLRGGAALRHGAR